MIILLPAPVPLDLRERLIVGGPNHLRRSTAPHRHIGAAFRPVSGEIRSGLKWTT